MQYHLSRKKCSWDNFLTKEGFKGITSQKRRGHPPKSKENSVKEVGVASTSKPSSTKEYSPSGRVTRSSLRKKEVEPGQPSPVIKELKITYVRKRKHTKSSEPQSPFAVENPRVREQSSGNKV